MARPNPGCARRAKGRRGRTAWLSSGDAPTEHMARGRAASTHYVPTVNRVARSLIVFAAACAAVFAVAACGGASDGGAESAPPAVESTPATSGDAEHVGDTHEPEKNEKAKKKKKNKKNKKKQRRVAVALGSPAEFDLVPAKPQVRAGNVTFKLANTGAIEHELIVIRTDLDSGALPTDGDGAAEEHGAVAPEGAGHAGDEHSGAHVGAHVPAGEKATVTVRLKPGNYALVCNLPGHYDAGMHANLTVVRQRDAEATLDG